MIQNSKGQIFYGMHFYPGVAEYQEPGHDPYRVFLNEDTIRAMDASFAGRPVFVQHVDGVTDDVDALRAEADGWVVESFYNAADGKHWVKFIVVTEQAEDVIRKGWCLSNSYFPKSFGQGGLWNGVTYTKEITGGEYEHLAIVPNPRYEESVIMTPEEFKKYNDDNLAELKRISNEKESKPMKLNFFKKAKVENAVDIEGMSVTLPKSGKEVSILQLVEALDQFEVGKMKVQNDSAMSVNDMLGKYKQMCDAMDDYEKKKKEDEMTKAEMDVKTESTAVDVEGDEAMKKNDDEDADEKKKKEKAENDEGDGDMDSKEDKEAVGKKKNEIAEAAAKKAEAKKKADALRNAHLRAQDEVVAHVDLTDDKVARGKVRYGSN